MSVPHDSAVCSVVVQKAYRAITHVRTHAHTHTPVESGYNELWCSDKIFACECMMQTGIGY